MPRIRVPTARLKLPDPPVGELPKPVGYPDRLADRFAIARHIAALTPGDIDLEFVEEYYRDACAVLRYVPLAELKEGPANGNRRIASRERAYARLPVATRPPLVVQHGEIEDGNHRYRVARSAGEPGMWCYVVVDAP